MYDKVCEQRYNKVKKILKKTSATLLHTNFSKITHNMTFLLLTYANNSLIYKNYEKLINKIDTVHLNIIKRRLSISCVIWLGLG